MGEALVVMSGCGSIELAEIEARLRELPGVLEAVVLAREDVPGQTRLVAYYTHQASAAPVVSAEAVRRGLAAVLSAPLLPVAYLPLAALPRTLSGVIDRAALPAPRAEASADQAPQGAIEEALASIWAELLQVARVGRDDNFFELGGDSLRLMQVMARVQSDMNRGATVTDFFLNPTLRTQAQRLASLAPADLGQITRAPRRQAVAAAPPAERTAIAPSGQRIVSRDDGATWVDIHTGKAID